MSTCPRRVGGWSGVWRDDDEVVVDSFAESRQHDVLHLAEELEHEDVNEKRPAWQLCTVNLEQGCGCLATIVREFAYVSVSTKSISVGYVF